MADVTETQQQIIEVSEMNINDVFDFYMTGTTSIIKSLGYGSLGAVFQAQRRSEESTSDIVIKPFSCTRTFFETIKSRVDEAQVLQNSKNVLSFEVKQLAEQDDNIATVFEMKLCEKSLFQLITEVKEGKVTPTRAEVLAYIIQALNGLREIQESGNVHFNLKPHNVLIDKDDTIKIADAGFTAEISQKLYNKPLQYNRFFSMNYLSPEYMSVVDGKKDVLLNGSSDIFSLGVVILELLGQDINIVSSIKLKSGIFDGVTVKEQYDDLAKFICKNMLCFNTEERKTLSELIEQFSEFFFFEVTQYSSTKTEDSEKKTVEAETKSAEEVVTSETKEEVVVESKTENIKVDEQEEADESEDEEEVQKGTPKKEQGSDDEYEILQEDQEVTTTNAQRTSAKKPEGDDIQPSQDSTFDQDSIEADNEPTQESERTIEEQPTTEQQEEVVEQKEESDVEVQKQTEEVSEETEKKTEEVATEKVEEVDTEALKRSRQIQRVDRLRLDFTSKTLTDERVETLFKELEVFTSLTHLTLVLVQLNRNTQIDDKSVVVLSEFLGKFTGLTSLTLKLDENKLTPNSLTTLNTAFSKFINLLTFEVSFGKQTESEVEEKAWETETISLVDVIKTWSTLQRLSVCLSGVKVTDTLVQAFTTYLKEHTTLTALTLDFDSSEVTEEVKSEFVTLVEAYTTLTSVNLLLQKKPEQVQEASTVPEVTETTEVVKEQTETAVENTEVVEEKTEVTEEKTEVVEEPEAVEEKSEVTEEKTEAVEEQTEVVEEPETTEEKTEAVEEPEVKEEATEVVEKPEATEEKTEVVEEPEVTEETTEVVEEEQEEENKKTEVEEETTETD